MHAACIVDTCFSVLSSEALGEKADIHTGGMDLKFPHHDNEIAQAEVTIIRSTILKAHKEHSDKLYISHRTN